MKKNVKIFFIISLIMFMSFVCSKESFAKENFSINFQADNEIIQENQTEVNAYIVLTTYNPTEKDQPDFIPTLGYEAVLEYDKNVFESATIQSLNDWSDSEYYANTGKILSTTKKAKANTKIAQITLKLKNNVNIDKTTVLLKNMIVSDGKSSIEVNPYIDFTFEKSEDTLSNGNNTPSITNPSDKEENDKVPATSNDDKEENSGTLNNDKKENSETLHNDKKEDSNTPNNGQTTTNENKQEIKKPNEEEKIKVDVIKDGTTAEKDIPQTGEETIILTVIIVTIGISVIFFMRYIYISRKIKGL